jgi:hypothetical protein
MWLASRHRGAIEHNDLCGILSDCVQDVKTWCPCDALFTHSTTKFLFLFTSVMGNEIN